MRLLLPLLLLLSNTFAWCSSENTIHALLIGDTNSDLKSTVRSDLEHVRAALKIIARKTKMHLATKTLTGSRVTTSKVRNLTNSLAKSRGVSIFYFTGHGFRLQDASSPWPRITFMKEKNSMNAESISTQLINGKARLTLLLLDCCNQFFADKAPYLISKMPLSKQKPSWSTVQDLFVKTDGVIIMAAAVPGEVARGSASGSFFTTSFLESLSSQRKPQKTSWQDVFVDIQRRCTFVNQHPIGYVNTSQK